MRAVRQLDINPFLGDVSARFVQRDTGEGGHQLERAEAGAACLVFARCENRAADAAPCVIRSDETRANPRRLGPRTERPRIGIDRPAGEELRPTTPAAAADDPA